MPPEHEYLEAQWLVAELKRSAEYARKAYYEADESVRRLYLANLVGTLDTLYSHYKFATLDPEPSAETDAQPEAAPRRGLGAWLIGK